MDHWSILFEEYPVRKVNDKNVLSLYLCDLNVGNSAFVRHIYSCTDFNIIRCFIRKWHQSRKVSV